MNADKLRDARTVGELRDMLEGLDEDMPVVFAYDYGDYWHTEVAATINEAAEEKVVWSEYHRMFRTVEDESRDDEFCDDEDVPHDDGLVSVIVLR